MDRPTSDTTSGKADDEAVPRDVLERWKSAVDAHEPERVAVFTDDAIFQGLHPYTVGRQGVADYCASQPLGKTADSRSFKPADPRPTWSWIVSASNSPSPTSHHCRCSSPCSRSPRPTARVAHCQISTLD
ncbi:hypothetical protein ACFVHB_34830 [Kitasatospora sp. NPDC127111]|uniref:hypothetical protein n=1 Tax=Kitasatospora sp. NPDC127111 TaxID=3345363 RepID=UPI003638DC4B